MGWWGIMETRMVVITTTTVIIITTAIITTITTTTTTVIIITTTTTTYTVPSTPTQTQHGTIPAMADTPTAQRSDNPTRAVHTTTRLRHLQRPGIFFSIHQPQELLVRIFCEKERQYVSTAFIHLDFSMPRRNFY